MNTGDKMKAYKFEVLVNETIKVWSEEVQNWIPSVSIRPVLSDYQQMILDEAGEGTLALLEPAQIVID